MKRAWPDMREFLSALEHRGDLVTVDEEVDWEYQAVALTRQSFDMDGPAFHFARMRDSDFGCISGLFGSSRPMYEPPKVLGLENWPLGDVLTRNGWSMPDPDRYLRQDGGQT